MMKKILFIILLFTVTTLPQGLTRTLFDTTGWSPAGGYSPNYGLYYFTLLSNPGGRINANTEKIDSLLAALIVYTQTNQLIIKNDTLVISDSASGQHAFITTATSDSVAVYGLQTTDVIILTPQGTSYNVNDLLYVNEHSGYFKVYRNAGGTSGLSYNWIWIKRY